MSIKLIDAVLDSPLKGTDRLVMIALCDAGNDVGFCYPGYERLIKRSGCSRDSVARSLKKLKEWGLIEVTNHSTFGKGKKVNCYQLDVDLLKSERLNDIVNYKSCSNPNLISSEKAISPGIGLLGETPEKSDLPKVRESDSKSPGVGHEPSVRNVSKKTLKEINKEKIRFKKPDEQEVIDYFVLKNSASPETEGSKFWNHFEASNWKRGSTKLVNWQAAANNWMKNDFSGKNSQKVTSPVNAPTNSGIFERLVDRSWADKTDNRDVEVITPQELLAIKD